MRGRNRFGTAHGRGGNRRFRDVRRALAAATVFAALPGFAAAAVLRVPLEHVSIGAALSSAARGDTILVAPGTYFENVVWPATQGLKLLSESGASATVIDGSAAETVIGINQPIDSTTMIRGFTLRNGQVGGT